GLTCKDRLTATEAGLVRTVVVDRVDAKSAGASAGIRQGDVLVKVGDLQIGCSYDVERALLDHRPGDKVAVVVRRQGKETPLRMALGSSRKVKLGDAAEAIWRKLGLRLAQGSAEVVRRANAQLNGGMEVTAVAAKSPAATAHIRVGDLLVGLHQWETLSPD